MFFHEDYLMRAIYSIPVISVYMLICFILFLYHTSYLSISTPSSYLTVSIDIIFFLVLWSYTKCIITDPSSSRIDPRQVSSKSASSPKSPQKFCMKCRSHKPERTHHCSICNRCILRMDHHCPWIGNCVGVKNQKYFIQFLLYASLDTFIIGGCFGETLIKSEGDCGFFVYIGFFWTIGIAAFLIVLGGFNLWMAFNNTTTLEIKDIVERSFYDEGPANNFEQVFGKNILGIFLPVFGPLSEECPEFPNEKINETVP